MKNSSNYLKAGRIAAALWYMCRREFTPEEILGKVKSKAELDFYYSALCGVKV